MKKKFDFGSTYILTESTSENNSTIIDYDLTAFANDDNEIYIFAWDNEESLLKWKELNLNNDKHQLIEFNNFFYSFVIENKANIKWIFLNPDPKVNDYKTAVYTGAEKMDLESTYGSWAAFDYYFAHYGNSEISKFYAEIYAELNKKITCSSFLKIFGEFIEELSYFKLLDTYESQYLLEKDGEHFELNNIKVFDVKEEKLDKANIDFFGHCFQLTYGIYNKILTIVFEADRIIEFEILSDEDEDMININLGLPDFILDIQKKYSGSFDIKEVINEEPVLLIVILKKNELAKLNKYYSKVNEKIIPILNFYQESTNLLVNRISDDAELMIMIKNLVKSNFLLIYLDPDHLLLLDYLIYDTYKRNGRQVLISYHLLSMKVSRDDVKNLAENQDQIRNEVLDYLNKMLVLTKFISEKYNYPLDSTLLPIYLLAYKFIIESANDNWKDKHGFYFKELSGLNIDEAIDIYISLENVNHQDREDLGLFIFILIKYNLINEYNGNYFQYLNFIFPKIEEALKNKRDNHLIDNLRKTTSAGQKKYTISDVDLMDGREFEIFVAKLFNTMGYITNITKASGDQGIDVIAEKNGIMIGIQAKCYTGSVGNWAIQEAVAGKNHYRLDKVIVITNSIFTESAQKLAQSNSVLLWDRNILKDKLEDLF